MASQIALKRSANNERQLQQSLSRLFRKLSDEVLGNLEEYWSEYQLLQGQINLITKPVLDTEEEYNRILEKYIRREYKLGSSEAERLVKQLIDRQAMKADYGVRWKSNITNITTTLRKKSKNLFGTLKDAEDELLEKTFTASKRTLARVTSQINQIITEGYTSGKGINVVAGMLQKRFDQLETWEAKRIARTEIHNAHNNAVMRTYNNLGVEYTQWIAASDDRTRDSHVEVDREIIPIGATYSNGLAYPGDTSGPIEEWINCRCSNAPFVIPYGYMAPEHYPFREEDLIKI
jgi:SPP1 gp7 family putative phage head morphogenesis protein